MLICLAFTAAACSPGLAMLGHKTTRHREDYNTTLLEADPISVHGYIEWRSDPRKVVITESRKKSALMKLHIIPW